MCGSSSKARESRTLGSRILGGHRHWEMSFSNRFSGVGSDRGISARVLFVREFLCLATLPDLLRFLLPVLFSTICSSCRSFYLWCPISCSFQPPRVNLINQSPGQRALSGKPDRLHGQRLQFSSITTRLTHHKSFGLQSIFPTRTSGGRPSVGPNDVGDYQHGEGHAAIPAAPRPASRTSSHGVWAQGGVLGGGGVDVRDGTYAMEHRTEGGRCGHSPFPFSIYLSLPPFHLSLPIKAKITPPFR